MRKVILFLIFSFISLLLVDNQSVIFAQQQQDTLFFQTPIPTQNPQTVSTKGVQQVDWVYNNQGRCWSAWAAPQCSLDSHEGGVLVPAMRDLDQDGQEDITCSQGGGNNSSTITNVSNRTITINCERYTCTSCTSGNGTHAQCDGGIDSNATRVVETVELTPGCEATCTMDGAFGTCLERQNPPTISHETNDQDEAIQADNDTSRQNDQTTNNEDPTGETINTDDETGDETDNQQDQNQDDQTQEDVKDDTDTPDQATQNQTVQDIINAITEEDVEEILLNLIDNDNIAEEDQLQTRYTGTSNFRTEAEYVQGLLDGAGIDTTMQEFTIDSNESYFRNMRCPTHEMYNVIGRIKGRSDSKYILMAHLDSREATRNPALPAPGADDNASGVAAVVAAAQVLAQHADDFEHTVEFALFDGEEVGLCGSGYYIHNQKDTGSIRGVINLDMLGWPMEDESNCIDFHYKHERVDNTISDTLVELTDVYDIDLQGGSIPSDFEASDHKHFWDRTIPAVIGTSCNVNVGHIHEQTDRLYNGTPDNKDYILNLSQISATSQTVAAGLYAMAAELDTQSDQTANRTQPQSQSDDTGTSQAQGKLLPAAFHYFHYEESINDFPPTWIYGNLNRSYSLAKTNREIDGISRVTGNVEKMIMFSEMATLQRVLENHGEEMRNAGVTWIGYNAERDGRTPQSELDGIYSSDPETNTLNQIGQLATQYGFQVMFGPTTPMWNQIFGGRSGTSNPEAGGIVQAMIGEDCALDGIAFQEQNQLRTGNWQNRLEAVTGRTAFFRKRAGSCNEFISMVQIMPQQCEQNASWEECRAFYQAMSETSGNERIDSVGIWANPNSREKEQAITFIEFLRQ